MREFEIRNYMIDKHGIVTFLVRMDLDTYNEALNTYIRHMQDDCFNDGFRVGNNYPSEEELADMDDDDSKKE